MENRHQIENSLRDALERARNRYKIATELFHEIFSGVPDGLPRDDGIKRIELVAAERRRSVELLSIASRRWSDFLVFGTVPEDLSSEDGERDSKKPN